jgi:hypothetical protein
MVLILPSLHALSNENYGWFGLDIQMEIGLIFAQVDHPIPQ